jgi:hypothetical protein
MRSPLYHASSFLSFGASARDFLQFGLIMAALKRCARSTRPVRALLGLASGAPYNWYDKHRRQRRGEIMDVTKILAELRQEREQIDEAIVTMERLVHSRGPRRGRPPAWLSALAPKKRRGRPPGSKNKAKMPATTL